MSNPHKVFSCADPAAQQLAGLIPEPDDSFVGGGKLIPVDGQGEILGLIAGRNRTLPREPRGESSKDRPSTLESR